MPTLLEDPIHTRVLEEYAKLGNKEAVAKKLNISRGKVRRHISKAGDSVPVVSQGCVDPLKAAEERRHRTRELAREREQLEAVAGEKSFRSYLETLIKDGINTPFKPVDPPKMAKGKKSHIRHPLLHLSDWHFEEIVKPAAVLGLNEYNIDIACKRVYRVIHAFIDWKKTQEAGGNIMPELTVALNGDFLTGTLHGLERHSSAPNVIQATLKCGRLIALALRDLAPHFAKINVVGTVGNHGRLPDDKKVPTKDPTRSFDYMAYAIARELLRDCKHIGFTLPESYGAMYSVSGHTVYQTHGNFMKQTLGIVGYGIRRFVSNLAANVGSSGNHLKYALMGHFHSFNASEFAGVTAFIGSSLIGTQEYGFLSGGSVNRSAQQAYIFDSSLGHVSTETLYGDGEGYEGTYILENPND